MSEKEEITKEKLGHSGLFDFAGVYSFMHHWLKEEENYGVIEREYSEKVSGDNRDIRILWTTDKYVSDYFKHEMEIKITVGGMSDVEVEIEGKKKKMNKGKLAVEIKGFFVRDPDSKWDTSPVFRFMRDIYDRYVVPGRIFLSKERLLDDVRRLKEDTKSFLDLSGKR
jgi:hypothetical protein